MLKRIFWLAVLGVAGWLAWMWLRQRKDEFTDTIPQFAPPRPLAETGQTTPFPSVSTFPSPPPPASPPAPASRTEPDQAPAPATEDHSALVSREAPTAALPEVARTSSVLEADSSVPDATESAASAGNAAITSDGGDGGTVAVDESGAPVAAAPEATAEPAAPESAAEPEPTEAPRAAATLSMTTANENERASAEATDVALTDAPPLEEEVTGFCVRCKTKRVIQDAHRETTESGRRAARGTCPVCGANMFTFLANGDDEPAGEERV